MEFTKYSSCFKTTFFKNALPLILMNASAEILEIPVSKTRDVNEFVKWFELKKVYKKKHPSISLEGHEQFPALVVFGLALLVGMALIILEERGKLKTKTSAIKKSPKDFLEQLKNSSNEKSIEQLRGPLQCYFSYQTKRTNKYSSRTRNKIWFGGCVWYL